MNFGRCEGALAGDAVGVGYYLLPPSQLLGSSRVMALALPLLFVPEAGLKVPIVWWYSLCQGMRLKLSQLSPGSTLWG